MDSDNNGAHGEEPPPSRVTTPDSGGEGIVDGRVPIFGKRFRPYLEGLGVPFPVERMLDVGSGPHGYAVQYRQLAREVHVIDLHDFSASYAMSDIRFHMGDITRATCFEEATFDLVVAHSVFEHLAGVDAALNEIDRVLRKRGHAFITIRPLYYSAQGFHRRDFSDWAHLEGESEDQQPAPWAGAFLNKLTLSSFLESVGRVGWRIRDFTPKFHPDKTPPPGLVRKHGHIDLLCMEFFGLFEKII